MDETTPGDGWVFALGVAVTLSSVAGYAVGVVANYPGRSFTVTGVMVGITLVAIGTANRGAES